MFKDYDKYLSKSLKVYLFVLVCVFIMKIVGLDYFGLDLNNPTVIKVNNLFLKYKLDNVWYLFTLYIYIYTLISMSSDNNNKKMKIYCIFVTILSLLSLIYIKPLLNQLFICLYDIIFIVLFVLIFNKFDLKKIKRTILFCFLNILFQMISLFIRNIGKNDMYFENFLLWQVINIDYIILTIIAYKVYFMKGDAEKWVEVYSSSLKKINLKNLLKKLQKNLHNFSKKEKVEKLSIIIYIIFSLIWNTLSLVLILFIAKLNDTFIECIFILTSFWLSKRTFGKPFHLSSMTHCFIVSNITYYILNRITTPLGISILIPIMLGVGLSYVTSKLVKKIYKPLYRGMPQETFEETILKVVDKDSDKYKICYDYYINKKRALYLANKYSYSEAGIRKITNVVNNKIKELN